LTSSLENVEPFYVPDTHALVWHLAAPKKLGDQALAVFRAAQQNDTRLIVSAIVVAEMFYLNKKHNYFADFAKVYSDLKNAPHIRLVPFDPDEVLDFTKNAAIPEIHDRIIAGLARRLNAPLITIDPQIISAGTVRVIW